VTNPVSTEAKHNGTMTNQAGDAGDRLEAVLEAYALITHHREHHGNELVALLRIEVSTSPARTRTAVFAYLRHAS
jgi:hypothetical protein